MPNEIQKKDVAIYELGILFLRDLLQKKGKDPLVLEKYWHPQEPPENLNGVYVRLLESVKNRDKMKNAIDSIIEDVKKLECVLEDFSPKRVMQKYPYSSGWESVSNDIRKNCAMKKEPQITERSLWPKFCQAVISGARFLSQFEDYSEFSLWISGFDKDDITRSSLVCLLSYELDGIGFALACDLIMRLGHRELSENFCKPDVHLKAICKELRLCEHRNNQRQDYEVFKAIQRIARNASQRPYKVDQIFWIIGSGDPKNLKLGRNRDKFIKYVRNKRPDLF